MPTRAPRSEGRRAAPRVLILDRDEVLRALLGAPFADRRAVVRAEADDIADRELGTFAPDIVVLGLSIPSKRRFTLLRQLAEGDGSGPVAVSLITGGKGRSLDAVVSAGNGVYLRTPFDPAALLSSLVAA
jgi:DNA-binding response OmpR family regulator